MRLLHLSLLLLVCSQSSSGLVPVNSSGIINVTGLLENTSRNTTDWSVASSAHTILHTAQPPSQSPPGRSSTGQAQSSRPAHTGATISTTAHPPASSPAHSAAAARSVHRGLQVIALSVLLMAKP